MKKPSSNQNSPDEIIPRQAKREGNARLTWTAGATLILTLLILGALVGYWRTQLLGSMRQKETIPTSDPRVQAAFESGELARETARLQSADLNSYRWTDTARTVAALPVTRAMEVYLKREQAKGPRP